MGGFSSEYRISINSGNVVYKNLDRSKYKPYRVHILQKEWFVIGDGSGRYGVEEETDSTAEEVIMEDLENEAYDF